MNSAALIALIKLNDPTLSRDVFLWNRLDNQTLQVTEVVGAGGVSLVLEVVVVK